MSPALIKLRRSRHHLHELEDLLCKYQSENASPLLVQEDPVTARSEWVVSVTSDIGDSLSVCLGDLIHNARASLDLLVNTLLIDAGGTPTKETYFPFVKNAEQLPNRLTRTGLDKLKPHHVSVLKSHPPAQTINPLLYAVHDLDIVDKHRSILPVAAYLQVNSLEISEPCNFGIYNCRFPLADGARLVGQIPAPTSDTRYANDAYAIFTLTDEDLGFAWSTIYPGSCDGILEQARALVNEVEKAIAMFHD